MTKIGMLLGGLLGMGSVMRADLFLPEPDATGICVGVEVTNLIESCQSEFEKIDVYQTERCGLMLVLDGIVQLTSWDNYPYHEMLAHVPLMNHPSPRRVLIVGGGDGGTLTEVLKHAGVEEVVLCEIDPEVVRVCKIYFPEFNASFSDPRVRVIHQDGAQYIKTVSAYFDVICVDASDPVGPGAVLYTHEFYQDVYRALTHDGIVVAQGESPWLHRDWITSWSARNRTLFPVTGYYYALVPTYPSGVIGFLYASKRYEPRGHRRLNKTVPAGLRYYSELLHDASFVLPESWAL